MKRFINWLGWVPIGVWIFVALSGALLVVCRPSEIAHTQRAIDEMAYKRGFGEVRQDFIEIRDDKQYDVWSGACVLIIGTSLAVWKWTRQRREAAKAEHSTYEP